uniref:APC membrane recruitment protein 2 n=1 Tax=Salmo trutta TaxID=8032 RepID=A0A674AHD3_SALTR
MCGRNRHLLRERELGNMLCTETCLQSCSECVEPPPPPPPCDPQPPGKINKAAFKLFGKRRSGMAGFFSFRNKGVNRNGNSVNVNSVNVNSAGQVKSLSKSLSFFSLLRRGSVRANENTGFGRRGRGLKGFFSSMKWRRKENVTEGEGAVAEVREREVILTELVKDITLTLEPQPRPPQEDHGSSEAEQNTESAGTSPSNNATTPLTQSIALTTNLSESLYTPSPSPLRTVLHSKPKTSISSVTATPPLDQCDPPSEPSVDRLCSVLFTDVTSLKSFDSLTGCGDIIADAEEEGAGNGGGGGESPSGSGVVAYMGGGEEMASPDGVDDADMQGLWHMLPSGGENSPTFLRSNSHLAPPRGTERKLTQVKSLGLSKIPVVGGGGGGRVTKLPTHAACQTSSPNKKETKEEVPPQQDVPALRDEGYWDTPSATPTATPDNGFLRNQRLGLLCDSCSGDALYDLYNEELERSDDEEEEEDLMSTPSTSACEYKLSPLARTTPPFSSSSFHSMKGSTSLPRESKIPLSVRQTTPPHSVSQSALSSVHATAPPSDTPTHAPPPARTRIPVSKVPVRRPGNKAGNATQGPAPRK